MDVIEIYFASKELADTALKLSKINRAKLGILIAFTFESELSAIISKECRDNGIDLIVDCSILQYPKFALLRKGRILAEITCSSTTKSGFQISSFSFNK